MKKGLVFGALLILGLSMSASAATVVATTPSGATDSVGDAVSAKATFVTSLDTVVVTLENLLVEQKDVGQNVTDVKFSLSTGQTSGSITSSSGRERTVASNKSYT